MMCGFEVGTLARTLMLLGVIACAGTLIAQSPPYGGYTNSPFSTGTGVGDQVDDVIIRRGTTTLISNLNTGGAASPFNTFYSTLGPANLIPGQSHQIDVRPGASYSQYFTVYIDYNNDGDFADAGETVANSGNIAAGTLGTMTFTPPTGVGGVKRLRVHCVYSPSGPHTATASYTYGEAEDYLVNLGFAIETQSPLPTAAENQSYSTTLLATNGATPYNWNTAITGLPSGVTAAQVGDTLVLSGTPATGSAGTYNFTVSVTDNASESATAPFTMYVTPPPAAMPFADDFSTGTGWLLDTGWQRGSATAFTGNTSTGPTRTEPGTDNSTGSDNNILGHMIGADYTNSMPVAYATSPPVNCSTATTVHLRFYRWLGVNSGDWARVQVTNNGTNWTDLYSNNGTAGSNTPSAWEPIAYDASAVAAGNSVVQFRFVIGPTDTSIVNVGWCIDDFEVLDPGPPLMVEEGGTGGTVITDNETVGGLRDWGIINTSTNSSVLTVAFTNNGITPITFGSYSKTGANPSEFFVIKQITTNPLPVGQSDTMEFQFNSPNPGVHTCKINVPHNVTSGAGTSPFEINLRAEAVVPIPDLEVRETNATGTIIPHNDPATGTIRDFGSQDIAAGPTASITITVVNNGTGNLGLSTPDMGGTWWNQFVVTVPGTFPSSLAPSASASFEVAFDPTSTGVKDAYVRIPHTDGSKPSPYYVPVLGNGTSSAVPVFTASDSAGGIAHNDPASGPRDFGNVQVATSSAPITITITNNGGVDLTLGTPTLGGANPGEFTLDLTGYITTVTTGNSTSFDVTFDPTSVGQKDATVTVTHNDATVTSPFIINVTGNGVTTSPTASVYVGSATGPQLANPAAATGALDFGVQDVNAGPTAAVTIYVENTGTAPLTVANPAFNPATTEFLLQNSGSFGQTLAIGASATFDIVFDPTSVGTHTAVVEFVHNDAATGSPFVINVSGQGVLNAPLVQIREASTTGPTVASGAAATPGGGRDLGSVDVTAGATAPITVVVLNQGTLDLNLGSPSLAGPNAGSFTLDLTGFTAVVAPGNSTSFDVAFDPNLGGIKDAQVEFTHDDPTQPSPYLVRVVGTAVDPTGVLITTTTLPASSAGQAYPATQLQAAQGTQPYAWSVYAGTLPAGLNLSTTGLLDGTPIGFGGSYRMTVRVTDSSNATHEREFVVAISSQLTGSGRAASSGCVSGEGSSPTAWLAVALFAILGGVRFLQRQKA